MAEIFSVSQNVILSNMKDMFDIMKHGLKKEIHHFKNSLDVRLSSLENTMAEKVQHSIRDEMSLVRQHMDTEVARLDSRLDGITTSIDETQQTQNKLDMKYLQYEENEIQEDKFKNLLCGGVGEGDLEVDNIVRKPAVQEGIPAMVGVGDLEVDKTVRKPAVQEGIPAMVGVGDLEVDKTVRKPAVQKDTQAVVITTCKSKEDKGKVSKSKSKLKDKIAYANVYVEHDRHRRERQYMYKANLRILFDALGREKFMLRGGRLCRRPGHQAPEAGLRGVVEVIGVLVGEKALEGMAEGGWKTNGRSQPTAQVSSNTAIHIGNKDRLLEYQRLDIDCDNHKAMFLFVCVCMCIRITSRQA